MEGLAYLPTVPDMPPHLKVADHVKVLAQCRRVAAAHERAASLLDWVGAGHCADRLVDELDPFETVLVAIARALMLAPGALVLENPLAELYPVEREHVTQLLRSIADEGRTVVLITNDIASLLLATRMLSLSGGALIGSDRDEAAVIDMQKRRRLRSA